MRKLLLLGLLALSLPALAADLMQFYQQARTHDAQYLSALHQLNAARNQYRQLRAQLLPQLALNADITRDDTGTANGYTLSVEQPLLDAPALARWRKGEHLLRQAEANYKAEQQGLILRVAQAYFDVLAAQDELALAEAEMHALAEQLVLVKQRLQVGSGTITEVHETQARYDQAQANELLARNVLSDQLNALYEIAPLEDIYLVPLKTKIPLQGPKPMQLDHWLQLAKVNNPRLHAAIEAEKAAEAEYKAQMAGYLPNIDLSAQKGEDDILGNQDKLVLQFSLPLFQSGRQRAAVAEARDLWLAAQANRRQQERAVQRQMRQAFQGLQAGILRVQALQQALKSSEQALDATIVGMEVGTRTNIDVLNARQELFRTRRDYARSRYDYLVYRLQLQQAAGQLNEADLQAINLLIKV
jgi:outer membrane protein